MTATKRQLQGHKDIVDMDDTSIYGKVAHEVSFKEAIEGNNKRLCNYKFKALGISKEEIFELYVNKIFLGNRSYGIEAAANTYFNKNLIDLSISESATIAAMAQLPSRVNPVKDPRGTLLRRNWILSRMYLLKSINKNDYLEALNEEVKISKNIDLYEIDASHLAEVVRQEVVTRYGLRAYKEGWSV